jgi:hypothetical protein
MSSFWILRSDRLEFLDNAINKETNECILWPFQTTKNGYALMDYEGRTRIVSRVVCEQSNGPPPTPKHQAAHSNLCVSRRCINKHHLRWATQSENFADDRRGDDNPLAKLTEEQVLEVRRMAGTTTQSKIAGKFGVSVRQIRHIISGARWQWLDESCDAELLFDTTRPRMKDLFA